MSAATPMMTRKMLPRAELRIIMLLEAKRRSSFLSRADIAPAAFSSVRLYFILTDARLVVTTEKKRDSRAQTRAKGRMQQAAKPSRLTRSPSVMALPRAQAG